MNKRVIVYVDGFNLYRGMKEAGLRHLYWLDLMSLARRLTPRNAQVLAVKYVTSRILNLKRRSDPAYADAEASRIRQSHYIDALAARGVLIYEGKFKRRPIRCFHCGSAWIRPEEKLADVQIATQLLSDAFRARFDAAMLITGDADITPAVEVVVKDLGLTAIVAFPPKRELKQLRQACSSAIHINRHHLGMCQLPDQFTDAGRVLKRPPEWTRGQE